VSRGSKARSNHRSHARTLPSQAGSVGSVSEYVQGTYSSQSVVRLDPSRPKVLVKRRPPRGVSTRHSAGDTIESIFGGGSQCRQTPKPPPSSVTITKKRDVRRQGERSRLCKHVKSDTWYTQEGGFFLNHILRLILHDASRLGQFHVTCPGSAPTPAAAPLLFPSVPLGFGASFSGSHLTFSMCSSEWRAKCRTLWVFIEREASAGEEDQKFRRGGYTQYFAGSTKTTTQMMGRTSPSIQKEGS